MSVFEVENALVAIGPPAAPDSAVPGLTVACSSARKRSRIPCSSRLPWGASTFANGSTSARSDRRATDAGSTPAANAVMSASAYSSDAFVSAHQTRSFAMSRSVRSRYADPNGRRSPSSVATRAATSSGV